MAVKKYSVAGKWALIAEQALADNPNGPDEDELKEMARLRSCSVMDLLIEEADRDIAAGRVYPMPCE